MKIKQNGKLLLATCAFAVFGGGLFSLNIQDNSLASLRANAQSYPEESFEGEGSGTKCVTAENSDCKSPDTDTIYNGYRLKKIGT